TLKMPAFEWVHVQLHQQKGMISLSPPTICNSATYRAAFASDAWSYQHAGTLYVHTTGGYYEGGIEAVKSQFKQ
ncbi:hypothetical protein, partial [Escherichia coli]